MGHKTDGHHCWHCIGAVRCSLECQCSMINARYSRNVLSQYEVSFQTIEYHFNCPQFLSSFSHKTQNFGPQNQVVNISSELFSAHKKLILSVSLQAPVSVTAGGKTQISTRCMLSVNWRHSSSQSRQQSHTPPEWANPQFSRPEKWYTTYCQGPLGVPKNVCGLI